MSSHSRRRGAGFTMVELLVAVTIGLLLTVTIAQIFLGSRRTYSTTDDLARMQENMRFAHDVLNRTIRMAGYMSYPANSAVTVEDIVGVFATSPALNGVDGDGGAADKASVPDSITVAYQGTGDSAGKADGVTRDCAGTAVAPGVISTSTFTIGPDPDTKVPSLLCSANGADPIALVSDVENMQILYGEETSGDFSTDRYGPRNSVGVMDRVMSVRIALLFRTPNLNVRSEPDKAVQKLHGGTVDAPTGEEATRIRRTMTMTIALRNRTP